MTSCGCASLLPWWCRHCASLSAQEGGMSTPCSSAAKMLDVSLKASGGNKGADALDNKNELRTHPSESSVPLFLLFAEVL
jgi:hypothetical protein